MGMFWNLLTTWKHELIIPVLAIVLAIVLLSQQKDKRIQTLLQNLHTSCCIVFLYQCGFYSKGY